MGILTCGEFRMKNGGIPKSFESRLIFIILEHRPQDWHRSCTVIAMGHDAADKPLLKTDVEWPDYSQIVKKIV
jgi:hypothetical protein